MSTTITGIVTNGLIVPSSPLPEGAMVDIHLQPVGPEVPLELQEEFDDWERAGAGIIESPEPDEKQPRTSLAAWAEANAEDWGTKLNSEDVEGFTGRRF